MKELICIVCPKGCRLKVDEAADYAVSGNSCPRGAEYGRIELTRPTRVVTSTVRCTGGTHPRCPVKTDRPVPKERMGEVMAALNDICASAPIQMGQVLLANVCETEANIVATRDIEPISHK